MTPPVFRILRQHFGITQADVARKIGVSKSAVCQFEKGRENAIAPWRILPVADALRKDFIASRDAAMP